jgi:hypothetical protein
LNEQLRLMRQLAKRQGSTFHRELDDTHGLSSQQIGARALPRQPGIQASQDAANEGGAICAPGLDGDGPGKACRLAGTQFDK